MGFKKHHFRKSQWMTKEDCGDGTQPLTPAEVYSEAIQNPDTGRADDKIAVRFKEDGDPTPAGGTVKPWIVNLTNADKLYDLCGCDDSDGWIGKQIVLFNDQTVPMGTKRVGGIRVRAVPEVEFNDELPSI